MAKKWKTMNAAEKKAAAEANRQKIKMMADWVAKLPPEGRERILAELGQVVTIEGHALSDRNCLLCYYQRRERGSLSVVGGFAQWRRTGRVVKRGEKGIKILIPCKSKGAAAEAELAANLVAGLEGEDVPPTGERVFFKAAVVFDISQTELVEDTIREGEPTTPLLEDNPPIDCESRLVEEGVSHV